MQIELIRSTEEEAQQIENVRNWQQGPNPLVPASETSQDHLPDADEAKQAPVTHDGHGLAYLQKKTARDRQNVFAPLMEGVKSHSLGQISNVLRYDEGGNIGGICKDSNYDDLRYITNSVMVGP